MPYVKGLGRQKRVMSTGQWPPQWGPNPGYAVPSVLAENLKKSLQKMVLRSNYWIWVLRWFPYSNSLLLQWSDPLYVFESLMLIVCR